MKLEGRIVSERFSKVNKIFKLKSTITDTLTCIGTNNEIIVFNSIKAILDKQIEIRLEYYSKRKAFLIDKMTDDITILLNKIRFIQGIIGEMNPEALKVSSSLLITQRIEEIEQVQSVENVDPIRVGRKLLFNVTVNTTEGKVEVNI